MTVESAPKPERQFTRDGLPWVVGAAALAVYLATLNHWVTLSSLALVDRLTGWDWQPPISQPLLFLLTYPFRWLPPSWVPLALNGLTAVCASLTLAILARSVALLPHDRLKQQRLLVRNKYALLSLPNAWVPMVLATAALGLQLTFWEHAIAATGEMLDLLLFAYVIRCMLEHRIQPQQSWLGRATFVFGAAMANNWAMAGFLPLFLVALLRFRRLRLFDFSSRHWRGESGEQSAVPSLAGGTRPLVSLTKSGTGFKVDAGQVAAELRFLLRMALLGLAGLSLFLVLPLAQTLSPDSALSFWQALHAAAASYKANLYMFSGGFLRLHRDVALVLGAISLLPVLLLSIRVGSSALGGGQAREDVALLILQLMHVFLLLICIWTMFDPPFGSRQIGLRFGLPMTFLPLYYLSALSIGYYSGFFLLLFGADTRPHHRPPTAFHRVACRTVPKLVYLLTALTLAGLVLKNAPAIRAASARYLDQFARLATASLPPEGAVVLSDDPGRLAVLQAELTRAGKTRLYPLVGTRALPYPSYRAWLRRKYPGRWPDPQTEAQPPAGSPAASVTNAPPETLGPLQVLARIALSNRVYCVEPGVGFMLERFYLQPRGLLQELKFYPTNSLSGPPLSSAELAENEAFWKRAIETGVAPLLRLVAEPQLPRPAFEKPLLALGHLQTPPPIQAKVLARWYSGGLDRWGVTLQRNAQPGEAARYFALAQDLNADNLAARVNLQCSSNLLARQKMTVIQDPSFQDRFAGYQTWNQILTDNGPFDEPSYCYQLGLSLASAGMLRQAAQQFERVKILVPSDHSARLILGELFYRGGLPDRALQTAAEIRAAPELQPLGPTNEVEIALLEAEAWFAKTNRAKAEGIIQALLAANPENTSLLNRAETILVTYKSYSNALQVADLQLQSAPDDPFALILKSGLFLLTGDFSNAIPLLTRSLEVTNMPGARLNRGYAYLQTGRLEAAEADYQELLRAYPNAYGAYHGLGEIAWRRKDTNTAIRYYQHYLSNSVAYTEESSLAVARLKSLQQTVNSTAQRSQRPPR